MGGERSDVRTFTRQYRHIATSVYTFFKKRALCSCDHCRSDFFDVEGNIAGLGSAAGGTLLSDGTSKRNFNWIRMIDNVRALDVTTGRAGPRTLPVDFAGVSLTRARKLTCFPFLQILVTSACALRK